MLDLGLLFRLSLPVRCQIAGRTRLDVSVGFAAAGLIPLVGDAATVVTKALKFLNRATGKVRAWAVEAVLKFIPEDVFGTGKVISGFDLTPMSRLKGVGMTTTTAARLLSNMDPDQVLRLLESSSSTSAVVRNSAKKIGLAGVPADGPKAIGDAGERLAAEVRGCTASELLEMLRKTPPDTGRGVRYYEFIQVAKDAKLASSGKPVKWVFGGSGITGTIGPTKALLTAGKKWYQIRNPVATHMTFVYVNDLRPVDGVAHFSFFLNERRTRLIDLAHHLKNTDGPLAIADGTPESLRPLWEWFVDQVDRGMPQIPNGVRSSLGQLQGAEPGEYGRARWFAEELLHYCLDVARGVDPNARWKLIPKWNGKIKNSDGNTVSLIIEHVTVPLEVTIGNTAVGVVDGDDADRAPTRLWALIEGWFDRRLGPGRATIDLRPLAAQPRLPLDDPRRLGPVGERDHEEPPASELASGSVEFVAKRAHGMRLDAAILGDFLATFGVEGAEAAIKAATPETVGLDYLLPDLGIGVELLFWEGRLRFAIFHAVGATTAQWKEFRARLKTLEGRL